MNVNHDMPLESVPVWSPLDSCVRKFFQIVSSGGELLFYLVATNDASVQNANPCSTVIRVFCGAVRFNKYTSFQRKEKKS